MPYASSDERNIRRRALYAERADLQQQNREGCRTNRLRVHPSGLTMGRVYELKKKFNITPEYFSYMLEAQDGRCAICNDPLLEGKGGLAVDHNHRTGQIRAILCNACNSTIGWCDEDPARLRAIIQYLEQHQGVTSNADRSNKATVGISRSANNK
jgi:Recombination endonuclease VII